MKVAIAYDRVNKWGGAERVLLTLHEIFPKAPLYTSVYSPQNAKWAKIFPKIKTSFLQKISFARNNHEFFAPLMPLAFSLLNFDNYDLVISVTSEFAKNINVKSGKHICYCLTPTRYLWSGYSEYFPKSLQFIINPFASALRKLDKKSAKKPDLMIAISKEVQKRIKKYYGRGSEIIYPPANSNLKNSHKLKNNYYLIVSRLVKYKKIDLAIEAFNELNSRLIIVGSGREEKKLQGKAKNNIKFVGQVNDHELANYYANAKALIFPQEEDFGITAVEAQSFGIPVIAYKKGGALDIVVPNKTGVFFARQDKRSLIKAINKLNKLNFDKKVLKKNAKRFSNDKFKDEFLKLVNKVC